MDELCVLMYHASYRDAAGLAAIDAVDRPYAVALEQFAAQLDAMAAAGYRVLPGDTVERWPAAPAQVLLTFDDGHRSNAEQLAPALAERGLSGLFFVTADYCRRRPDYCDGAALRAMRSIGMALGTHGCSHRYVSELSGAEARAELADSKAWLEDVLGEAVVTMSFPGGRYGVRELALAAELGYRAVHTSDFALARPRGAEGLACLPRIAVRARHDAGELLALMDPLSAAHRRVRRSSALKAALKKWIGNRAYDALYRRFATEDRPAA